jgi:hypothetical protein
MTQASYEIDHVWILVERGAPEADLLRGLGMLVAPPVPHEGQGTVGVPVMFENVYLELLSVEDEAASQQLGADYVQRLAWRSEGQAPFGVGLREVAAGDPPLPMERYTAPWLQPGTALQVFSDQSVHEPALFVLPDYLTYPALQQAFPQVAQALASKPGAVTGVELTLAHAVERSAPARWVAAGGMLSLSDGSTPHLHIEIEGGAKGEKHDLRPSLPLTIAR